MKAIRMSQLVKRLEQDQETLRQLGMRFQIAFDNNNYQVASEITEVIKRVLINIPFEIRVEIVNSYKNRLPEVSLDDPRWDMLFDLKFKLSEAASAA